MIGWLSIIGEMLSFALKKITEKKIDLKMDERRKASRQFLTLYFALGDLEVLTKEIIIELKTVTKLKDISFQKEWTRCIFIAVDETTQRFLESTQGLREILEVFDPALALSVGQLEIGKFGLLNLASCGFTPQEENIDNIIYTYLPDKLASMDLEKYYQWYKQNYPLDFTKSIEWEDWVLCGFVREDDVHKDVLILREPESVERLLSILTQQSQSIEKSRELLKLFIDKNFEFTDILAVRKSVKKLDINHVSQRMSDASRISFTRWISDRPIRKFEREEENIK